MSLKKEAWDVLRKAVMYFRGEPFGTIAATTLDPTEDALNYNQVHFLCTSSCAFSVSSDWSPRSACCIDSILTNWRNATLLRARIEHIDFL